MKLSELFQNIDLISPLPSEEQEVRGICYDSRNAYPGCLFFCLKGAVSDGHAFAHSAYTNGCRLFVAEHPIGLPKDATVLLTSNTRRTMAIASGIFYGHPDQKIRMIGITGTKGKTSTALLLRQILVANGIPTGYIGTNGVEYGNHREELHNTTPEAPDLYRYLSDMLHAKIRVAVIEVSSQAVLMDRILGVHFDMGIFTNLSPDHIGPHEHVDFEDYRNCKRKLFTDHGCRIVVCNADDPQTVHMLEGVRAKKILCSTDPQKQSQVDYYGEYFTRFRSNSKLGIRFSLSAITSDEQTDCELYFPGKFSMYNAMLALAAAKEFHIPIPTAVQSLKQAFIPGRFELIETPIGASVVIDYAHNGISLSSLLRALREYHPTRLICLFGSVGGRTVMRRKELAQAGATLADFCILTSDNPDNEPPEQILDDIANAFPENSCAYQKITDREQAIRTAIQMLNPGDILLLAGKGHETYQLIAGKYLPFSERNIVKKAIDDFLLCPAECIQEITS